MYVSTIIDPAETNLQAGRYTNYASNLPMSELNRPLNQARPTGGTGAPQPTEGRSTTVTKHPSVRSDQSDML